ncbi:hypothetical protein [Pedobacter sp. MW01-1-1]|uniref:hypothetical protein n=1 Tax=Pedobacter sp. MW01-1-1 TaxID=3383027 RepID=UPI003FF14B95
MLRIKIGAFTLVALILNLNLAFAQQSLGSNLDTLKNGVLKSLNIDSLKKSSGLDAEQQKKFVAEKINQSKLNSYLKSNSLKATKKIELKDFSIGNSSLFTNGLIQGTSSNFINSTSVSGQLLIWKFPIDLDLVNNYNPLNNQSPLDNNLFKMGLAKPDISQLYKAKLNKYKQFKSSSLQGLGLDLFIKKQIQTKLESKLGRPISEYPNLQSFLNNPLALKSLLEMDEEQIKMKLNSLMEKSISAKIETFNSKDLMSMNESQVREKLEALLNKTAEGKAPSLSMDQLKGMSESQLKEKLLALTTELQNGKSSISTQQAAIGADALLDEQIASIANMVQSIKADMNESGLDEETISFLQKFVENKVTQKELQNFFISELAKQPKLSRASNLYSKIKEFQLGNFSHKIPGSFLNRDLFLNGFNFSLHTLRGPVTIGLATNKDIGQPKDAGFSSSNFSNQQLYSYISVPTTNFSFGSGKLSWVGVYDKSLGKEREMINNASSLPKNNLVFTLTQGFSLKNFGKVTVDLSKSATQYKNMGIQGFDNLYINETTMGNYYRDDFFETLSMGFTHAIDEKRMGLNSSVYFNYSGIGFQNPSQPGIGNMNMRFGGNVKKNFFKNKLTFTVRTDIKNTPISANDNSHWRNYAFQLNSRIRISKSYILNVKYIENGINKVSGYAMPIYGSKKLQADLTANYKIAGIQSFSYLSLGNQSISNSGMAIQTNVEQANLSNLAVNRPNLLTVNYTHNLFFTDFSLNGNLFYNKEFGSSPFIGDMLNSDLACQYSLWKSVSLSTGATYLNNQNIAKQIGIKQNIQLLIKKRFDINAYLDLRKNLINPLYPELFSTTRAEFSVRYYLEKQ